MKLSSMRARMTATLVLAIALVMLVVCSGLLWYAQHAAERNADLLMNSMAERVGHDLGSEGPEAGLGDEVRDMKADNLAFLIVDATGGVIRQSPGPVPIWPRTKDDGWRVVTNPAGVYTIVIGLSWEKTAKTLRSQSAALLFLGLCVILTAGIGAWLLVGRTLSPIGALSRQAQAATTESLRVHLSPPSRDAEVVELVATLNGLLARLAETVASRGRFYAAASHELRTPLQALTGHLEMALARERTREEYRAGFEEAYQQARQLSSLVRDLLLLNQLDAAPSPPSTETVNLTDICERTLGRYAQLIAERALRVRTRMVTDVEVLAPPTHVDMLARNLIENAAKYATPGGVVGIEIDPSPDSTRLEVFNECPPLPAEAAAHLFEPFYRPDESRALETGGNGLGLAICKAIAVCNAWTLTLLPDAGGSRIAVVFGREGRPKEGNTNEAI
jgi:signal transduction histidine kinase